MVDYRAAGLVGRRWSYGKNDCYGLIRDFYKLLGIELPEFERPKDFRCCKSIWLDQLPKNNFYEIALDNRRPNDLLIFKIGTKTPMHAAVLLPGEMILHQKAKSVSCREHLSLYYVEQVNSVFRYGADRAKGHIAR